MNGICLPGGALFTLNGGPISGGVCFTVVLISGHHCYSHLSMSECALQMFAVLLVKHYGAAPISHGVYICFMYNVNCTI